MTFAEAEAMQSIIDNGMAWRLEGAVGRAAFHAIEAGYCMLGEKSFKDYWGTHVPSRTEVDAGTVGSEAYWQERQDELAWDEITDQDQLEAYVE